MRINLVRANQATFEIYITHFVVACSPGLGRIFFDVPKSSFGEHKLCKMITKDSSNMCWVFWDAMIFCNNFAR